MAAASLVAAAYSYGAGVVRDGSQPADVVVRNARVFTADDDNPWAEAVAVEDERISFVGDDKGVLDFIGPNTRVLDGRGQLLTPGFIDNHCHPLWIGGLNAFFVSLYDATSVEEVGETLREYAAAHPDHPFIMGIGWHYKYMPGGLPTKEMADEILPDRPLFLMSYGGESGWVNSITLERMQTRNPEALSHFRLEVDEATGEPTGVLYEFYAINPLEYFTEEELGPEVKPLLFEAMTRTLEEGLSYGITTVNDVQIYESFIPYLLEFKDQGGLDKVRARGSYYISHHGVEEEALRENLARWKKLGEERSDGHLRLGDSVKLYVDGVESNHTAFMVEPYANDPESTGHVLWTPEDFNRVVEIVDAAGIQCCVHAVGDAGIKMLLDAYERARDVNGERDARHRVEHCSNPRPGDYRRMAELGVHAAMQPCHFYGDVTVEEALGPERLQRLMPWRSLEEAGVTVSFGSDWCAGPMNPVLGFLVAGLRMNYYGNSDWGEHEKISTESILRHYTIDCARALMMEDDVGSLEVGKYGDFVLFSEDLLNLTSWWFLLTHELEPDKLDDFVVLTAVGGEVVYHRPGEKF